MLDTINTSLLTMLESISVASGYFTTTQTTQQEDLAKASYPLYNLYLYPAVVMLDRTTWACLNADRYLSHWLIKCYDKLPSESSNAQFEIDAILSRLQEDVKVAMYNNFTLGGTVEGLYYISSRRVDFNNSDVLMPKYLEIMIDIPYSLNGCQTA